MYWHRLSLIRSRMNNSPGFWEMGTRPCVPRCTRNNVWCKISVKSMFPDPGALYTFLYFEGAYTSHHQIIWKLVPTFLILPPWSQNPTCSPALKVWPLFGQCTRTSSSLYEHATSLHLILISRVKCGRLRTRFTEDHMSHIMYTPQMYIHTQRVTASWSLYIVRLLRTPTVTQSVS